MIIGQFNARGPENGIEHWFDLIRQELIKRGHEVRVFWLRGKQPTTKDLDELDFCLYHFTQVAQHYMRIGIPFCVLPSANDIFVDNGARLSMVSKYRKCKFITHQSSYHLQKYKEWGIQQNFQYVPMPVRVDLFRKHRKYNPDEKYLAGGRLVPKKGLHQLKGLDDNLRVFGDGPLWNELQYILPNAEFLGYLKPVKLKNIMERSSVYLFPAVVTSDGDSEGISNTIKEAMLMRLPVICSSVAGNKELENVVLVDDWSTKNIRKVLDNLSLEPNIKGEKEIRNHYNSKFAVNQLMEGIEKYG